MNRAFFFLLAWGAVLGLGLTLSGSSCGPKHVTGEYDVQGSTGATTASVTFASPTNSASQTIGVSLPWTYSFPASITEGPYLGTYVYLAAQNESGSGSVTVTIKEDGNIVQQRETLPGSSVPVTVFGTF